MVTTVSRFQGRAPSRVMDCRRRMQMPVGGLQQWDLSTTIRMFHFGVFNESLCSSPTFLLLPAWSAPSLYPLCALPCFACVDAAGADTCSLGEKTAYQVRHVRTIVWYRRSIRRLVWFVDWKWCELTVVWREMWLRSGRAA
jgi:hypothetical protein